MPRATKMKPSQWLGLTYIAAVILIVTWTAFHCRWQCHLQFSHMTCIGNLPTTPAWLKPPPLEYESFRKTLTDLPNFESSAGTITVVMDWEPMLIDAVIWFWWVSAAFGVVARIGSIGHESIALVFARSFGLWLSVAAGICLVLWTMVGGWGAPLPLFFAACGIAGGAIQGWAWCDDSM